MSNPRPCIPSLSTQPSNPLLSKYGFLPRIPLPLPKPPSPPSPLLPTYKPASSNFLPQLPQLRPLLRQQSRMLGLQHVKLLLELLVPGKQHEDLEAQRRGADEEVGEGESACKDRHCFCWGLVVVVMIQTGWMDWLFWGGLDDKGAKADWMVRLRCCLGGLGELVCEWCDMILMGLRLWNG
jgi:hypothetical protein